jgi:hypothetical protein
VEPFRVVIGGQPNCGKSTLAVSLQKTFEVIFGQCVGLHELDVYSDTHECISGLKSWSRREKYNPRLQPHIDECTVVTAAVKNFIEDASSFVLGDLPCQLTNRYLPNMVAQSHAAIVLGSCESDTVLWQRFFGTHGVGVICTIVSRPPTSVRRIAIAHENEGKMLTLDRVVIVNSDTIRLCSLVAATARLAQGS